MVAALELWKVRALVWWQWKRSPEKLLQSLQVFENTEDDSAWQLLRASHFIQEPSLKAELFNQVMEETFHAQEFRRVYKELSGTSLAKLHFEKIPLYKDKGWYGIFAYCLIGEASAAQRFKNISLSLEPGPLQQMLQKVVADEVGHIHKAQELLDILPLSKSQLKRSLLKIRWQRGYESWLRVGRKMTDALSDLLLSAIYYSLAGLFSGLLKQEKRK